MDRQVFSRRPSTAYPSAVCDEPWDPSPAQSSKIYVYVSYEDSM